MAIKLIELPDIGEVRLEKRRGSRHIRLSVTNDGQVRVSMPNWTPYASGVAFVRQKSEWLKTQIKPPFLLQPGMLIGKKHRLEFERSKSAKLTSRVTPATIRVHLPIGKYANDKDVQAAAIKACIRALKQEAETVLPGRLRKIAGQNGFRFKSVEVKRLKSRWGSCNHQQEIVLNCFLMQLPWELIDYVLLHELVHTQIMAHGPKFWAKLAEYVDQLPEKRKAIRNHRPTVSETLSMSSMA